MQAKPAFCAIWKIAAISAWTIFRRCCSRLLSPSAKRWNWIPPWRSAWTPAAARCSMRTRFAAPSIRAATAMKSPFSSWKRILKRSSTATRRRDAITRSCAAASRSNRPSPRSAKCFSLCASAPTMCSPQAAFAPKNFVRAWMICFPAVKISVPSAQRSCPSAISVAFRARLTWCLTCAFCPIRIISRISAHTRVWKRPCATSCWAKRKPASFWGIYMNWWIICCRCINARASAD